MIALFFLFGSCSHGYTVIAEKLHTVALLGMTTRRLKDYFDLSVLLERETLDSDLLAQAVKATF